MQNETWEYAECVALWVATPEQEAQVAQAEEALATDPELMAQYVAYLESLPEAH